MNKLFVHVILLFAVFLLFAKGTPCQSDSEKTLRLGIIGLDTLHVIVFTELLNDPSNPQHVPGAKVVAAFKGGSPDNETSRRYLEQYTSELRDKWKVEIVPDIPALCQKVDAVLLESVDGRPHLQQLKPVVAARKPVFIDKPLAASYKDAKEIARLADEAGVPWFSSSGLRFWEETVRVKNSPGVGKVVGVDVYGPSPTEPHHPDLMWYGIHPVEMLFTVMGSGCESVTRVHTEGTDIVIGKWKDGRLGMVRGIREGQMDYGITIFGDKGIVKTEVRPYSYRPLLVEIVKFFQTGIAPVRSADTLEMFAFMEAADVSKSRGGAPALLSEITK